MNHNLQNENKISKIYLSLKFTSSLFFLWNFITIHPFITSFLWNKTDSLSNLKLIIDYNHNDHNFNLCVSHHCQQLEQWHMLRCKLKVCQSCKLLLLKKIHLHSAERKMDLVFTNYCCKLGYISKLLALKFYFVY